MDVVSSIKSWPTMTGDTDFVKLMANSVQLTMNKSRVVSDVGSK